MGLQKNLIEQRRRRSVRKISRAMPNATLQTIDYFTDADQFNSEVMGWVLVTEAALVRNVRQLTGLQRHFLFRGLRFEGGGLASSTAIEKAERNKKTASLADNITHKTKKNGFMGQIERISFQFPLHGIWLHHGVSRGHRAGNPRRKVDWFNSLIDARLPVLADIMVKYYADAVVKNTMKIH